MTFCLNTELTQKAHQIAPYTAFIGLEVGVDEETGEARFRVPYQEMLLGNTLLPAIHGGLIGGFMEGVASLYLKHEAHIDVMPKMVDFSLDYLRSGKPQDMYANCILTRQGSRIANLAVKVWQSDYLKPIAIGRSHFLMPQKSQK